MAKKTKPVPLTTNARRMNAKRRRKAKPKELVFTSVRAFMHHYFPSKPKPGPLIVIPRPSVGP